MVAPPTLKLKDVLNLGARQDIVRHAVENTIEHIELWLARKDADFHSFDDHAWQHLKGQLETELTATFDGLDLPTATAERGTPDG